MKAITFQGIGSVGVERLPDPTIVEPGDAIVRVERTAICGSDMHVFHGREKGLDSGTVMGHEFVGRVVEIGPDVRGPARDDKVLSPFTTSCGGCFYCRQGLTARCERGQLFGWVEAGRGLHGAQAEYVRVPLASTTLVAMPEEAPADDCLLLGDVLSTGYFCALRAGIGRETVCCVVGCGPVGLMAVVGAIDLGAARVFAVDRIAERLELARGFGAEPIDDSAGDAAAVIAEATQGRGADVVLEAVGSGPAHRAAFDLVRPGGTISVVGVHNEPEFAFTPAEAYDKNLTYRVGRCPARAMVDRLLPLVASRRFDFSKIITHRLPLDRGAEAYSLFDRRLDGCVKVVLSPAPG